MLTNHQLWSTSVFFLWLVNPSISKNIAWKLYTRYPDQDESDVCGNIQDVIRRNSSRFRKTLIRNENEKVIFANDDCRIMTPRARDKLALLADSRYYGVEPKVRVLQAWTEKVEEIDAELLHFEGRSLRLELAESTGRIQTGNLAKLAVDAGLDWVYFANESYIRASVVRDACAASIELVFLLDSSTSIDESNFEMIKQFVLELMTFFHIGFDGTRIAVFTYATDAKEEFNLDRYHVKSAIQKAVKSIIYRGGGTYTGEALEFVRERTFNNMKVLRNDSNIPKVLVLLTDGESNGERVTGPAKMLHKMGVNVFCIGVGDGVKKSELQSIASDGDNVLHVQDTNSISKIVGRLSSLLCSVGSEIKSCETGTISVSSGLYEYFRKNFADSMIRNNVTVEVTDVEGISRVYVSLTSKTPGPFDEGSVKNEKNTSPKTVHVNFDDNGAKMIYISVKGQMDTNRFRIKVYTVSSHSLSVQVTENSPPDLVARLSNVFNKKGLAFRITSGNIGRVFHIKSGVSELWTNKSLDREEISQYQLVVVAMDTEVPCYQYKIFVTVNVKDVNDNNPNFPGSYNVSILESAPEGSKVVQVKATDVDEGVNGEVVYSLISVDSSAFQINAMTGTITTKDKLDFEKKKMYSFAVTARDKSPWSRTGATAVTVNVLEISSRRTAHSADVTTGPSCSVLAILSSTIWIATVSACGVVVLCILLCFFCKRRRKRNDKKISRDTQTVEFETGSTLGLENQGCSVASSGNELYSLSLQNLSLETNVPRQNEYIMEEDIVNKGGRKY